MNFNNCDFCHCEKNSAQLCKRQKMEYYDSYHPSPLETFLPVNSLLIQQDEEAASKMETNNSYKIYDPALIEEHKYYYPPDLMDTFVPQPILRASEDTGCCMRFCCGKSRAAKIIIRNDVGLKVMTLQRHMKFCSLWCSCFPCFQQNMEVFGPDEELLGSVGQRCGCCKSNYHVCDKEGTTLFQFEGPFSACCGAIDFDAAVISATGENKDEEVGHILKTYGGYAHDLHSEGDTYALNFHAHGHLNMDEKALLLAAVILIDLIYFEEGRNVDQPGGAGGRGAGGGQYDDEGEDYSENSEYEDEDEEAYGDEEYDDDRGSRGSRRGSSRRSRSRSRSRGRKGKKAKKKGKKGGLCGGGKKKKGGRNKKAKKAKKGGLCGGGKKKKGKRKRKK